MSRVYSDLPQIPSAHPKLKRFHPENRRIARFLALTEFLTVSTLIPGARTIGRDVPTDRAYRENDC